MVRLRKVELNAACAVGPRHGGRGADSFGGGDLRHVMTAAACARPNRRSNMPTETWQPSWTRLVRCPHGRAAAPGSPTV